MRKKNFIFSHHAVLQLEARGLSQDIVLAVISNPKSIIVEDEGQIIYQQMFIFNGKESLIRVFVNEKETPFVIKTAYKTTKFKKYIL